VSAKRANWVPGVWGASLMYKLYSIGDRKEPRGIPACISLGVDISPSTKTLNFLLDRKELISLTVLIEKFNLIYLYDERVPGGIKGFLDNQEYCSHREVVKI
jgi:hypothetical protein